jgi:gamma-glutamylcyclotransferase (GGCT)/AIG2-like uncharacterized protein YtfP
MNKKHLYAFYGSLRNGEYNHNHFKSGMEFLRTVEVPGFKLYSLGSFPCVIRTDNEDDKLTVDLFVVTGDWESRIHRMELGAGYSYDEITVEGDNYGIYTYPSSSHAYLRDRFVPGGDWVKHLQKVNERATV